MGVIDGKEVINGILYFRIGKIGQKKKSYNGKVKKMDKKDKMEIRNKQEEDLKSLMGELIVDEETRKQALADLKELHGG